MCHLAECISDSAAWHPPSRSSTSCWQILLLLPPSYCSVRVVDTGVRALPLTVWVLTVPWLCALQLQCRAARSRQQHWGGRLLGGNGGDTRLASPHHSVTAPGPRSPGEHHLLAAVGHPTPSPHTYPSPHLRLTG